MPKFYTDEFKRAAVARLANEKRIDVAKDLGVSDTLIGTWKRRIDSGEPLTQTDRKHYDDNFKLKAVARLDKEMAKDVSQELGIHPTILSDWKRAFQAGRLPAPTGGKSATPAKAKPATNGAQRRRHYTDEFKRGIVQMIERGASAQKVAKRHRLHSGMVSNWRKQYATGKPNTHARAPKGGDVKKKNYYIKVADRVALAGQRLGEDSAQPDRVRAVTSSITLLRSVRTKIDVNDPVHLTAMLVLQTLEGKM